MDCSLPGSSVHRISQARTLEQVAISLSPASLALAGGFFPTEPLSGLNGKEISEREDIRIAD